MPEQAARKNSPVIGWEQETAVPEGHQFNPYLHMTNGRLHLDGLDLAGLFDNQIAGQPLDSPLEIVYLPLIRRQIADMNAIFADAAQAVGYNGRFLFAYASKANAAEEVIRTTLSAGAHHEMSSTIDADIARQMKRRGLLPDDRLVICNGFKPPGSEYAANIVRLRQEHRQVIPVIEELDELLPLLASGRHFDVGIRQKTYGRNHNREEMEAVNSRFGLNLEQVWRAASYIETAPNLDLRLYHAMVGSQILDEAGFVDFLRPGIEVYAQLRQRHGSLHIFDFGGGMPAAMTLDFNFNYLAFAKRLLAALQETCARYDVPEPDVMGEFGRYTTATHGAHLFKVLTVKENGSDLPWYIIDGSIMSSFPDSWALSEHFICLPLTHLDAPFQRVQLGGITCDSDDVYPPKPSQSSLYLPRETDDLYVGFFGIGAYQEMLGGVRGSKHCVLPEAHELLIERDAAGNYRFEVIRGQTPSDVLENLGYQRLDGKRPG